jgi:hypothetical protein
MSTAHPQNVIALIWDFDKTLIPGYMQDPIFKAYNVDGGAFWKEVNALTGYFKQVGVHVHPDTCYLNHLLTYVQAGRMAGLTNAKLRELGKEIRFHQGLPDLFAHLAKELEKVPEADRFELKLEHYIVSTGLREMVEGSAVRPYVNGIWASEFIETPPPPGFNPAVPPSAQPASHEGLLQIHGISQIAVAYDNTSKTRAIFEINKGSNVDGSIDVNATMSKDVRRVPFEQMIYIADGPSDVPAFSVLKQNGGLAYAVYDDASEASLQQVERLREDGRVHHYGPADYREGGPTAKWLGLKVRQIAEGIVARKRAALKEQVGQAPRHLS